MAKTLTGVVESAKNDKTITVLVTTHKTHPVYKKRYISSKRFLAHDEKNEAGDGDKVRVVETKPLSARKRFSLVKIIEKAGVTHQEQTIELPQKDVKPNAPKKAVKSESKVAEKPAKTEEEAK